MRLIAYQGPDGPRAAIATDRGPVALNEVATARDLAFPLAVEELVASGRVDELRRWLADHPDVLHEAPRLSGQLQPAPLLRRPPKILGVGLNYAEHAGDLGETRPDEPATFMKPATTIIAAGETIRIPRQSQRTTGEGELGLIIGRQCKGVAEKDAPEVLAGVTTIVDMTAEDILQRNPRFLTRAKSFDTFLALGTELVTLDELGDVADLEVTTVHNGEAARHNTVANMLHSPWKLVAFFSQVMPLEPGDVILTGTPGAVVLNDGDRVGCSIPGVGEFSCPVADLKVEG